MFQSKKENPDYEYFNIFDTKVGVYRTPMLALNKFDIMRQLESLFRDPSQQKNDLLTNAEDFALFRVGEYSKKTGAITPCTHEHIVNLHEIRSIVMRKEIPVRNDSESQLSINAGAL